MNRKIQINLTTVVLLLVLIGCKNPNLGSTTNLIAPNFKSGRELVAHLDVLFGKLSKFDALTSGADESLTEINEQIRKTIESVSTHKMLMDVHKQYRFGKHHFLLALSDDSQMAVFSWDSKSSGFTNSLKNIVLYAHGTKVTPTSLYNNNIFYHQIHTINSKKDKVYHVLHGKGKSQENSTFYRMDAFSLLPNGLEEAPIFPDHQSTMISASHPAGSLHNSLFDFNIEKDGSLILKPEFWGETIAYRPLEFSGGLAINKYVEGATTLPYRLTEANFTPKNNFNFINGSELPVQVDESIQTTFIFKDQTKVALAPDKVGNRFLAMASIYNAEAITIGFEEEVRLIGKQGDLLFFGADGYMAKQKIVLYHLSEKKFKWSKSMHQLMLQNDILVYTEQVDSFEVPNINTIDCDKVLNKEKAYFKVYSFGYNDEHPIVEYTNQILCAPKNGVSLALR